MPSGKLVEGWTFKRTLPEPFQDYSDDAIFKNIYSKYCTQPQKRSTLHAATLRAILAFMELEAPTGSIPPEKLGALGSQNNGFTIAEYPSKTGELHVVVYNRTNGQFTAGRYQNPDAESTPEQYVFKESGNSGAALLFSLMPTAMADDEFEEHYQKLKQHRDDGYANLQEAAETAAILCDNLYRRIRYEDSPAGSGIKNNAPNNGMIAALKQFTVQKGTYSPTNTLYGEFQVLKPGGSTAKATGTSIAKDDFVSNYLLSESRTLSPEEELSVPDLPDWYIIPPEVKRICEHAKLTTNTSSPMRNFLLRGPAGTGKTEGAKAIAAGLHLPYRCITCSANTEIFDLLGQILPDVDGRRTPPQRAYPSFQDIMLDPATAYQKLTGTYDEGVSEDTVYQKLIDTIFDDMHELYANRTSQQNFKYVDTPLVEAIRYGYVLELQEPTVIANPGVLVGLNSLLDRCNSVFLPNGETITRHPDTVIVVTTNIDYAGCRQMNQSVISRMNLVVDLDEPDEETLVQRVLGITGCTDKKAVKSMARIVKSISEYCRENLINDGTCGVRELISWVQSYMVCGDMNEAAQYTVLSSASADVESRMEIETSCVTPQIA